jgi:hypothetical protein
MHPRPNCPQPRMCSLSARGTAGWRATRVRGRGRRGSWRGLSLGVAPAVRRADTTCTRCSGRARRDGRPRPALPLGPWTLVAAAGGRAAAHIAAHMMPSRPINPPTGSSRTPLGASSLVPSASNMQQRRRQLEWSAEIRSTAAGRLARAAGRRRAELAILLTLRGSGCSYAPAGGPLRGPAVLPPSAIARRDAPRRGPSKDRAGPMALLVKRLLKHT